MRHAPFLGIAPRPSPGGPGGERKARRTGRRGDASTFAAVRRLAAGFAAFLRQSAVGEGPVVVGYDRRFASEHFAAAFAEFLAANAFRALLTNPAPPPPAFAFSVLHPRGIGDGRGGGGGVRQ